MQEYFVNVSESVEPRKTFFSKALATDPDKGNNGTVSYHLLTGYEDLFGINQRSGEVFSISNLDRETKDVYEVQIVAKDSGSKQLSSSVKLTIHVLDINDNSPEFYPLEYFVSLSTPTFSSSRLPLDTPIVKILAYDKDDGINSEIRYNWDESNDLTQRHLRLNTETGEIFPQRLFSFSYDSILSKEEVRQVKVYATDGDGRRSPVSANIYLYLNVL